MSKATKIVTKGILLIAFRKPGYGFAAYNMLLSIRKFNRNIPVTLLIDNVAGNYLEPWMLVEFDNIISLSPDDYTHKGIFAPAKVKCEIYKYLPYDETLYLDVDGCATQDLQPLIDRLSANDKYFQTDVVSMGGIGDRIQYSWAPNVAIWEHFKLKDEQIYYSVQSSFAYIKKGKQSEKLFQRIEKNFHSEIFPIEKLTYKWGGCMPDELIVGGSCSQIGYDPESGIKPVFFGAKHDPRTFTQIESDHFILSIHGNGTGGSLTKLKYIEHYDKLMRNTSKSAFKSNQIMPDKQANNRTK